ncbi:MAG: hypothetical protein IAF38_13210 [Bacteroidia bacterium]|nr:hypothetical protein [Bacteroidia bacterium]
MKKLILIFFVCGSWNLMEAGNKPNTNSWSVKIGKKEKLSSWANNKFGDLITLRLKEIRNDDTLYAGGFLCGYSFSGVKVETTFEIKNEKGDYIAGTKIENGGFDMQIPLTTLLKFKEFRNGDTLIFTLWADKMKVVSWKMKLVC